MGNPSDNKTFPPDKRCSKCSEILIGNERETGQCEDCSKPKTVTLVGLNHRGKNRVGTFGQDGKFILKRTDDNKIFVESLWDNFRLGEKLIPWGGWLEIDKEVRIKT